MKKLIGVVILSALILSLLAVCIKLKLEENNMHNAELPQKVGEAIEGTYTVFVSPEFNGELIIERGNYSLISDVTEKRVENFFFNHPVGTYEIKRYYGSISQNSILEDLDDNEILLQIYFYSSNGTHKGYLIRNDKENRELYFHSLVNELELWRIRKPWDS